MGRKTYDRTVVVLILASPFVSFHGRLDGDDGRRRRLRRRLIVRSVPIRHGKTDPEDEETRKEQKRVDRD